MSLYMPSGTVLAAHMSAHVRAQRIQRIATIVKISEVLENEVEDDSLSDPCLTSCLSSKCCMLLKDTN